MDRRLWLGIVAVVCAGLGVATAVLWEAPPEPPAAGSAAAPAAPSGPSELPRPDVADAGALDPDVVLTPERFQADMDALRPALGGCVEDAPEGTRFGLALALSPAGLQSARAESGALSETAAVCLGDILWTHRWPTPPTEVTIRYPLVVRADGF